jgi:hypothetical protein
MSGLYYKKSNIPLKIKKKVWENWCYPTKPYLAQCYTCDKILRIPESLRKYISKKIKKEIKLKYIKHFDLAEFGHMISEYNGGFMRADNFVIQCKFCNCSYGKRNITNNDRADVIMIDERTANIDDNYCMAFIEKKNRYCLNKPLSGVNFCAIHLAENCNKY